MNTKQELQARIKKKHNNQLRLNRERLCRRCYWKRRPVCYFYLPPVTSSGGDCPYFQPKPEEK